eukprot:Nk52_evm16s1869 gene=Nk52_evmTU16s1869
MESNNSRQRRVFSNRQTTVRQFKISSSKAPNPDLPSAKIQGRANATTNFSPVPRIAQIQSSKPSLKSPSPTAIIAQVTSAKKSKGKADASGLGSATAKSKSGLVKPSGGKARLDKQADNGFLFRSKSSTSQKSANKEPPKTTPHSSQKANVKTASAIKRKPVLLSQSPLLTKKRKENSEKIFSPSVTQTSFDSQSTPGATASGSRPLKSVEVVIKHPEGRKRSLKEVTDLEVGMTVFSNIALACKEKLSTAADRYQREAIDDFYFELDNLISEHIDLLLQCKTCDYATRRISSGKKTLRKNILSIQKDRAKIESYLAAAKAKFSEIEARRLTKEEIHNAISEIQNSHSISVYSTNTASHPSQNKPIQNLNFLLMESESVLNSALSLDETNKTLRKFIRELEAE